MKSGHAASLVEQQNNARSIALFRSDRLCSLQGEAHSHCCWTIGAAGPCPTDSPPTEIAQPASSQPAGFLLLEHSSQAAVRITATHLLVRLCWRRGRACITRHRARIVPLDAGSSLKRNLIGLFRL